MEDCAEGTGEESLESRVVGVAVVILSEDLFRDLTGTVSTGGGAVTESVIMGKDPILLLKNNSTNNIISFLYT